MITFKAELGMDGNFKPTIQNEIIACLLIIIYCNCIVLSHKKYLKHTAKYTFYNILIISLLFLFITYCMVYVNRYLDYHLFYKKQLFPKLQGNMFDIFNQPHEPKFSPFNELIFDRIKYATYLLKENEFWLLLLYFITSELSLIIIVIYFEALYLIFRKYNQRKWFYILPVINKWKLTSIAQKPKWYFYMLLIPFVRIIVMYLINRQIAKDFKKSSMFTVGMTILSPIFYGILGLNSNEKVEPQLKDCTNTDLL